MIAGTVCLILAALWPQVAGADQEALGVLERLPPIEAQVVDDAALAAVQGKGAELPEVRAEKGVAVILWDEQGVGRVPAGYSSSTGADNRQNTSLTTQRGLQ